MTDQQTFLLPDLGEGLTEAEIVTWHVGPGDHVVAGQPLVSVETDKAVVEIPSPQSGRVARLSGAVGEHLAVGAVLVEFEADSARADTGVLVGQLSGERDSPAPRRRTEPKARPPDRAVTPTVKASPAARRKANELGIDIGTLAGTGPDGVIQLDDVVAGRSRETADAPAEQLLRGVRRAMARRMADAHSRVVPASVADVADIHDWQSSRPMPRLIRALVAACREAPHLHAAFDDEQGRLLSLTQIDLGVAMETDDGLFVPVLRDAGQYRNAAEIEAALNTLTTTVRNRAAIPEQMRGQSITLSNYGAVGGRFATMVVVPPQVAIVGAGRIFEQIALADGTVVARRTLPLSLTFDHRVVTGVEACRFLNAMIQDLQMPT